MSDVSQLSDDLAFVRDAVQRHDRRNPDMLGVYATWAVYVLVGYTLIDFRPAWANLWLGIAWIPGCLACMYFMRRLKARGEIGADRDASRRATLHWGGGIALAIATSIALTTLFLPMRGALGGQLTVCLIGLVYFLGGVHFDSRFLWLGPIMIAGGICVGFMPVLPWTTLGLVIALGLVLPSFFKRADHVEA